MKNLKRISDDDLVKQLNQANDNAVFVEIYHRYHAKLYSAAIKRCLSAEIAEEIVQDLFISLWTNRLTIHIHTSLSGYLFTCIRNLVLNQIQKETVRMKFHESFKRDKEDIDNSTMEGMLAKDMNQNINANLLTLPEKCRSVFELSRKYHKSNKQIACELGISEKTVENHITRAIKYLRVSLQHILLPLAVWLLQKS